jgi:pantothenate synthetase
MTLEEVDRIEGPVMVSLAVRIGRARLIDNEILG